MCVSVVLNGEKELQTVGELQGLIGAHPVVEFPVETEEEAEPLQASNCLCVVDLDATLTAAGFSVTWPDHRMYCEIQSKEVKTNAG